MKKATNSEPAPNSPAGVGGSGMHYGAHPLIFKKTEKLRNRMTPAEELLWNYLRNNEWEI